MSRSIEMWVEVEGIDRSKEGGTARSASWMENHRPLRPQRLVGAWPAGPFQCYLLVTIMVVLNGYQHMNRHFFIIFEMLTVTLIG